MKEKIKAAVVGHPVEHSMSPFIHRRLFELSGKEGSYIKADLEELSADKLSEFDVFNVTIPHKTAVIPFLSELDKKAELFGSVNTVLNKNGKLSGYTTDGIGCVKALEAKAVRIDSRVLILGNGGAARAIAFEMAGNDILPDGAEIVIAHRPSSSEVKALVAEINAFLQESKRDSRARAVTYAELEKTAEEYDLIINATSVGMYPKTGVSPISKKVVERAHAVFDAVYNPDTTRLLGMANECGVSAIYGMDMLVYQAVAAHEIWFGTSFGQADIEQLISDAKIEMRRIFPSVNIVLCGFMGCGKSTVGKLIAKKRGMDFVDLDDYVEAKAGMKISEIFDKRGEAEFRRLENEAARELARKKNTVIASGGGTVLRAENVEAFNKGNCKIIYIKTPLWILQKRLENDKKRPLLQRPDRAEFISRLLKERDPQYKKAADFIVESRGYKKDTLQSIINLGL